MLFDTLEQFRKGILADNPEHQRDQELVLSFVRLKGRPSRPIDARVVPRSREAFAHRLSKIPADFFDPFNRVLELLHIPLVTLEPTPLTISKWNNQDFGQDMVRQAVHHLDAEISPRLIPYMVDLFLNLEIERPPGDDEWGKTCAIVVPGSRTFDRAAEASRAYRMGGGSPVLMLSGKAPYYDPDNSQFQLTEAEANAAYLRLLGVPEHKIMTEQESMDTVENAEFLVEALNLLGHDHGGAACRVLLVTSPFHLARYRLNVELLCEASGITVDLYSIGSRASRYWAETYFLTDAKSGYRREDTLGVVFNEYLKIAFDICAENRPPLVKAEAPRSDLPGGRG